MKTSIHVNRHALHTNHRTRSRDRADIRDPDGNVVASVIYRPDRPLSCGAHVWVETDFDVDMSDEPER